MNSLTWLPILIVYLIGLLYSNTISIALHKFITYYILRKNNNERIIESKKSNYIWIIMFVISNISFFSFYIISKKFALIIFFLWIISTALTLISYFFIPLLIKTQNLFTKIKKIIFRFFPFYFEYDCAELGKSEVMCALSINSKAQQKYYVAKLIKNYNLYNLITSVFFVTLAYLYLYHIYVQQNNDAKIIIPILIVLSVILCRTIARSCEIIRAFYNDVIQSKETRSSLSSGERINLMVKSFIEIIVLNMPLYKILSYPEDTFDLENKYTIINHLMYIRDQFDKDYSNIIDELFESFGVMTYKSIEFGNNILLNFVIVLQVVTSMVLIVFSLAKYIGNIKNQNNKFYESDLKKWYLNNSAPKVCVTEFYKQTEKLKNIISELCNKNNIPIHDEQFLNVNISELFYILDKNNKYAVQKGAIENAFQIEKKLLASEAKELYKSTVDQIKYLNRFIMKF